MLRRLTDFILQSRLQGMVVAFLLSFIPLFGGGLSILIAALVTLRKGIFEGSLVLFAVLFPYLLGYLTHTEGNQESLVWIAIVALVAINVLTWCYALVLRHYADWSWVIEIAALSGMVIVGMAHLFYPGLQTWWATELAYVNTVMAQMMAAGGNGAQEWQANFGNHIQQLKSYATGLLVISFIINALFQLLLARWWQAAIFNPGGLRRELYQIRLNRVAAIIFMAISALAYLGEAASLDMLPIVLVAFGLAGLSVTHQFLSTSKRSMVWLSMIYLGLVFLLQVEIVILSLVGLSDSFLDFRTRFRKS